MSRAILVWLPAAGTVANEDRPRICRFFEQCRCAFPDAFFLVCGSRGHEAEMKILLAPWLEAFPGDIDWFACSDLEAGQGPDAAMAMILAKRPDACVVSVRADATPPLAATLIEAWKKTDAGSCVPVGADGNAFEAGLRKAVFFDRDGVVNRSPGEGYVLSPDQFVLNEGISEALRLIKARDWLAILVTSQKGVGKGLMTEATLDDIHRRMQKSLAGSGAIFDGIYAYTGTSHCPHRPKPDPEMIVSAAEAFFIDLRQSWMIGDADRDIEMGKAAGLAGTIRIKGEKPITVPADYTLEQAMVIPDLLKQIL